VRFAGFPRILHLYFAANLDGLAVLLLIERLCVSIDCISISINFDFLISLSLDFEFIEG
jgi:hypothetical protein